LLGHPQEKRVNAHIDKNIYYNYNIGMETIRFEWDPNKAKINVKKHGVTFKEAQSVFQDPEALVIDDPDHSQEEERFIILGLSQKANLLVVCHCYRESDTVIRIISARKATTTETEQYTDFT
jgi:uncharacterized DUF497 family protein